MNMRLCIVSVAQFRVAHNNQHHGENWAVAVLASISLALHSKPKPRQPSFACAGR